MPKLFSSASNRLVSSRCPECGAPVDFRSVPRDQSQVECGYCGTLINIPGRVQAHSTSADPSPARPPTITVVTSKGSTGNAGRGCGVVAWLTLILILVVGGIALASTTLLTSTMSFVNQVTNDESPNNQTGLQTLKLPPLEQAFVPKPRLTSAPVRLTGNEAAPVQMVITAYQENGSILLGFDPAQRAEIWRGPTFSERYYEMGIGGDAAHVYVADGAKLIALDRATGQTIWQTSLANNLQTSCNADAPCLQQVGDQVVTLARDGTVQGFAGATGAPLWSRRLNSTPRRFLVNGDQVILIDTDENNRAVVLVLNGVNGDLSFELHPACAFPNFEMRAAASDQYIVTPDGTALLVVGSGTYACVWRYSLADGALTWSYTSPGVNGPLPFTWSMSSLTLADPIVYFIKDENDVAQIYSLDTQSQGAAPQLLYGIEDHMLTVQDTLGDLLLVAAQPSFARDEVELWAIDRSAGERRWQRKLETTHTFDKWVMRPTDQGIFLAVCTWESDECRFELLDIATGTSRDQVRETTDGSFAGATWIGNRGYLTIDGRLYAINLTTAAVDYAWP